MAEPKRRMIVEGVDFTQLFHFPKLFRAVPIALQPSKMVVGVFMVLLLVTGGRLWDGMTQPRVSPEGILAGQATEADQVRAQRIYRGALRDYVRENRPDADVELHPARVLRDIRDGYRAQRADRRADDTPPEAIRRSDERYVTTVADIHRVRVRGSFESTAGHVVSQVERVARSVLTVNAIEIGRAGADLVVHMPLALWRDHKLFTVVYGLYFLIVIAVGGGAISRMTAMEIAGRERLRAIDALRFSMVNWPKFVLAPLLPLVAALAVALIIALLGVLTNVPVLDVLAGALYIVALLMGFVVAFLLIGYAAAAPMFIPAIACENCDAADAQQRSYAYVLSRPLHLIGYALVAAVALALGYLLVAVFAWATLNLTAAIFGVWTTSPAVAAAAVPTPGPFALFTEPTILVPDGATTQATAWFIGLWKTLILALVAAFVIAFAFAVSTILYLLMRRATDGHALEDIWRPGHRPGTGAAAAAQAEPAENE